MSSEPPSTRPGGSAIRGWGPEHALLAILRGDADNPARRALDQAGLSAKTVEGFIDKLHRAPPGPVQPSPDGSTTPNPAWYVVYGRAEGFASALSAGEVESVHRSWRCSGTPRSGCSPSTKACPASGSWRPCPATASPWPGRPCRRYIRLNSPSASTFPTTSSTASSPCCCNATRRSPPPRSGSTTTMPATHG